MACASVVEWATRASSSMRQMLAASARWRLLCGVTSCDCANQRRKQIARLAALRSKRRCRRRLIATFLDRNRSIHRRQMQDRRRSAILDSAVLVVPSLAGVFANARAAAHRCVSCRFDDEAGLEATGHAQSYRAVLGIGRKSGAVPARSLDVHVDGTVFRANAHVAAAALHADRAIQGADIALAGKIMQADRPVMCVGLQFAVDLVQRNGAIHGVQVNGCGSRRANEQINRPVLVTAWATGRHGAVFNRHLNLRENALGGIPRSRRLASGHGIVWAIPACYLRAAVSMWVHAQNRRFGLG